MTFIAGDYAWASLMRDGYLAGEYNKLGKRKVGPCEELKMINDNAYQLKLPCHF